ncbi:glycosyltransferase [Neobacillus notoginsengisoli]|uniref:Glycosyltransferase n=1 Tax=Neobacillus notoginsengisoli TaxID=1578198 RepID=A0A417YZ60_9BACI|nr:glycosyltransferase [Neobacillus notoginsengisoli]RHW42800.1 glycosyltransferase [Neobacillus notoginsengisoli]
MKISVIVAAYNVEAYIEKCLESIISQTYKNLEIIVVNDGSSDNTLKLIKKSSSSDNRITLINKPNGGLSSARNAGLDIATGNFIGFVDGDDYIANDMYEVLINNLIKTSADISICNLQRVFKGGEVYFEKYPSGDLVILNNIEGMRSLLEANTIHHYAVDKLYRRALFDGVRYPEGKIFEDVFTTYKVFAKSNRTVYSDAAKYYYVQRADSILRNSFRKKKLEYLEAIEEMTIFINQYYKDLLEYTKFYYAYGSCGLLIELLRYNYKFPENEFYTIGKLLTRNVRKSSFIMLKTKDVSKIYKILSICSLLGYGFCKTFISNKIIMGYFYKEKELF